MAVPFQLTLGISDIRAGLECDTDEDGCEYFELQKQLFHPLETQKLTEILPLNSKEPNKITDVQEKTAQKQESETKDSKKTDMEISEIGSDDILDDEDDEEDNDCFDETRLFERAVFCLQSHMRFIKNISKGVYLVEMLINNQPQCLKIMRRKSRYKTRVPIELRILSYIKSFQVQRHIQVLNGFVLTKEFYAFVSDYAPDLVRTKSLHIKPLEVRAIMRQLLVGIRQLHRNKIIHRDIKLSNVLWDRKKLTIVDFDKATWNTGHHMYAGTDSFMAPEVWRYERDGPKPPEPYTEKCDIYSAGVLFGCLSFGVQEGELKDMHVSIFREDANRYLPPLSAQLLTSMIRYNPKKRPSAHKLLQHDYFKKTVAVETDGKK